MSLHNPYYEDILKLDMFSISSLTKRRDLVQKYAWAIPTREIIEIIVSYSPIIEIGAGTGCWAYLINQLGGDILAFDNKPYTNRYVSNNFYPVEKGSYEELIKYSNRTLFLCWPPYKECLAKDCLSTYKGDTLIYIGETEGRCTANEAFFKELDENWELKNIHNLVTWDSIRDAMYIYSRK